jgi:predicted acyl esterase
VRVDKSRHHHAVLAVDRFERFVVAGDVTDGYDTTDWLSKQSWSTGKIGTYGCSYVGDVQILQAQLRHPNLTAMIPQAAGSSIGAAGNRYYFFGARKAGNLDFASGPFYGYNRPGAKAAQGVIENWWRQGMMGGAKAHYDGIVAFSQTDFTEDLKKITVPVLVMHGDDDQIVPYADSGPLSAKLLKKGTLKTYGVSTK